MWLNSEANSSYSIYLLNAILQKQIKELIRREMAKKAERQNFSTYITSYFYSIYRKDLRNIILYIIFTIF